MASVEGAKLTTHVLDTAHGKPAFGMKVALFRLEGSARVSIKSATTNEDGRLPEPLLVGIDLVSGIYELEFHVAEYFRSLCAPLSETPFLNVVPIRVGLTAGEKYHVPLLVSPWSFSTYRAN